MTIAPMRGSALQPFTYSVTPDAISVDQALLRSRLLDVLTPTRPIFSMRVCCWVSVAIATPPIRHSDRKDDTLLRRGIQLCGRTHPSREGHGSANASNIPADNG